MSGQAHSKLKDVDSRLRELAHRSDSGMDVTLSWHTGTNELLVCVYDEREDAYFELRPHRNAALDAYYHPYAYVGCDIHLAA